MRKRIFILPTILFILAACNNNGHEFDAMGTFETDEVIVSSELGGKILSFVIEEGDTVSKDKIVGEIDAENTKLQKEQVEESIKSLGQKTSDVSPQVRLLEDQLGIGV